MNQQKPIKDAATGLLMLVGIVAIPVIAMNLGSWIVGAPTMGQHHEATRAERREKAAERRRQKELEEATAELKRRLEAERAIPVKIVD